MLRSLVGSEMCIRDRLRADLARVKAERDGFEDGPRKRTMIDSWTGGHDLSLIHI